MRRTIRPLLAPILAVTVLAACSGGDADAEPDPVETTFEGNAATEAELPNSTVEDGVPEDDSLGTEDGEE